MCTEGDVRSTSSTSETPPPAGVAGLPGELRPGDRVGVYRILDRIGEGGFGVVFVAEQDSPIRRRVALKVIKPGMDTREVIARFEAERQALALMSHPNVAVVHDAGATVQGRPYFAMEYVAGEPLTDYCDKRRLSVRERLELLVLVCAGLQHAHQKGIVHRDIKPSNILVTEIDGKPVPKVIDFGVAKATNQRLTEKTIFTEQGRIIGTPEYMSPEQAEMTGLDVDVRTDVYSLGVVLYELLTGSLPLDKRVLREAGYEAIQRMIREVEPEKPSTRLSRASRQRRARAGAGAGIEDPRGPVVGEIAARRRTDAGGLVGELRGPLDWITMRALEKDRSRRYATPEAIGDDIQKYLRGEAVGARPRGVGLRVGRATRRTAVVVVAVAALQAGLAWAFWAATKGMSLPWVMGPLGGGVLLFGTLLALPKVPRLDTAQAYQRRFSRPLIGAAAVLLAAAVVILITLQRHHSGSRGVPETPVSVGYGRFDVEITLDGGLAGRGVQLDLVGVNNEATLRYLSGYEVNKYFAAGDVLRADLKTKRTLKFDEGGPGTLVLTGTDAAWEWWDKPTHLMILASIPGLTDKKGENDPRRLVLPLGLRDWESATLGIRVARSGLWVLTPQPSGAGRPGRFDVVVRLDPALAGSSIVADLIGVNNAATLNNYKNYEVSKYFAAGDTMRADSKTKYTMTFAPGGAEMQTLSRDDPIWAEWNNGSYLVVMAMIPGLADKRGPDDPRRLILPLAASNWEGQRLDIEVARSGLRLLTSQK